jgi:hypothetical protein
LCRRAEFLQSEPEKIRKAEEELVNKIKENSKDLPVPKFHDTEFFRQKEHIVDDVKSAVSKALNESISSKGGSSKIQSSSSKSLDSDTRRPTILPAMWDDDKVDEDAETDDSDLVLDYFISHKSKGNVVSIKK